MSMDVNGGVGFRQSLRTERNDRPEIAPKGRSVSSRGCNPRKQIKKTESAPAGPDWSTPLGLTQLALQFHPQSREAGLRLLTGGPSGARRSGAASLGSSLTEP
jgi:hypothetical protein